MFEKLVFIFMFLCGLCACSLPKKLDKPDLSKEINIKKTLIPKFEQNNKQVDIYASFRKHPNSEVIKDYSKYTRFLNIYLAGVFITSGVTVYGLVEDDLKLARTGFYSYLSTWLFSPFIRSKLFKSVEKHNQQIKLNSAQIVPDYDIESSKSALTATVGFSF